MKIPPASRGVVVMGRRQPPPATLDIEFVHAVAAQPGFLEVTPIVASERNGLAAFLVGPVPATGLAAEALDQLVDWLARRSIAWFEFTATGEDPLRLASRAIAQSAASVSLLGTELPQMGHALDPSAS